MPLRLGTFMHSVYFSHHFCLINTLLIAPVLLALVLTVLVLLALVLTVLVLLAL